MPSGTLEEQGLANPPGGDEEPAVHPGPALRGGHPAPQREELLGPRPGAAAKLEPGIADPVLVLPHEEVPFHPLRRISVRLHPARQDLPVQQEGELERQHSRFPGAVVAAEEQVPVLVPELLVVVLVEVQQPAAERLPALPLR